MKYPRSLISVGDCIRAVPVRTGRIKKDEFVAPEFKGRYTRTAYEGEEWYSHRLSYHLNVEEIPRCPETLVEGLVLHTCDNKWCINPEHLYLGTSSQNTQDMLKRNQEWNRNVKDNFARGWAGMSKERRKEVIERRNQSVRRYHAEKKKA